MRQIAIVTVDITRRVRNHKFPVIAAVHHLGMRRAVHGHQCLHMFLIQHKLLVAEWAFVREHTMAIAHPDGVEYALGADVFLAAIHCIPFVLARCDLALFEVALCCLARMRRLLLLLPALGLRLLGHFTLAQPCSVDGSR